MSAARLAEVLHPYSGRREDFAELRSSLLHEVIRRRRGLPILLAVLWVEVGRRAGIPVYPVGMPGHFLVGVGDPDGDHVLVDAFRGGLVVSLAEAERLAVDAAGIALTPSHLRPTDPVDVLMRVLTNIRVFAAGLTSSLDGSPKASLGGVTTRLWAVELSLLLPRHPVDLRRERAELLVTGGRVPAGIPGVPPVRRRRRGGRPGGRPGRPVGGQGLALPLQLSAGYPLSWTGIAARPHGRERRPELGEGRTRQRGTQQPLELGVEDLARGGEQRRGPRPSARRSTSGGRWGWRS